jgi:hypothetical protein
MHISSRILSCALSHSFVFMCVFLCVYVCACVRVPIYFLFVFFRSLLGMWVWMWTSVAGPLVGRV